MAATGNDDSDEVLESTSCSGVLSAEGLAPWGARESVCAPDTVGVSAGSGCWSAVSQTGGQRASEAQSSGGCESESSVSPRLGSVLWGLLQRHRSHWGGEGRLHCYDLIASEGLVRRHLHGEGRDLRSRVGGTCMRPGSQVSATHL